MRPQGLSTSGPAPVRPACHRITAIVPGIRAPFQPAARPLRHSGATCSAATCDDNQPVRLGFAVTQGLALSLISAFPAIAKTDFSQGSFAPESYYTALGLFALSLPGLWSLIKRSPKAKIKRITFEAPGPAAEGGMSDDAQARLLYSYMKKYNYELKSTGQVVSFVGTYAASRGVAAAVTFYTFVGMGSVGLVLSIAAPVGGNLWYLLTALSPLAGLYYWQNGTRQEEFRIKMLTDDDETRREIVVEGDDEEIMRMSKELGMVEKGKVYVKGLLEA